MCPTADNTGRGVGLREEEGSGIGAAGGVAHEYLEFKKISAFSLSH